MRSGGIWRWLSVRAWSRRNSKRPRPWWSDGRLGRLPGGDARRSIDKIFGAAMLLEKRFSCREARGGAGLKFGRCLALEWRAWSHWKPGRAVAKIVNLT